TSLVEHDRETENALIREGRATRTRRARRARVARRGRRRGVHRGARGQGRPPGRARRVRRALTTVVGLLLLAGCSSLPEVPRMPEPIETATVPTSSVDPASMASNDLSPYGFDVAERISVRVRN